MGKATTPPARQPRDDHEVTGAKVGGSLRSDRHPASAPRGGNSEVSPGRCRKQNRCCGNKKGAGILAKLAADNGSLVGSTVLLPGTHTRPVSHCAASLRQMEMRAPGWAGMISLKGVRAASQRDQMLSCERWDKHKERLQVVNCQLVHTHTHTIQYAGGGSGKGVHADERMF